MRELKFRVWDKTDKYYIKKESQQSRTTLNYDNNFLVHWHNYELEQFTGLKDKNDVDIYEGDILKLGDTCSFVVWGLDGWRFNSYMERGLSNLYRYVDTTNGRAIAEIIGNINENKDLLK